MKFFEEKEKKVKFLLPELLRPRLQAQNYLLFVFSSDRGLCGSYNQNVGKAASARIKELESAGKSVKIICYGKKAYAILKKPFSYQPRNFSHANLSVARKFFGNKR